MISRTEIMINTCKEIDYDNCISYKGDKIMKKRLLTTIIATVFTLSTLTACGEKPAPAPADPTPVAEEPTVKPEEPAPVVETSEEVKDDL